MLIFCTDNFMANKEVLVNYLCFKRPVKFAPGNLKSSIVLRFSDRGLSSDSKLVIQIKSELWNGEWIDVENEDSIPDKSVLKVIEDIESKQVWKWGNTLVIFNVVIDKFFFIDGQPLHSPPPSVASRDIPQSSLSAVSPDGTAQSQLSVCMGEWKLKKPMPSEVRLSTHTLLEIGALIWLYWADSLIASE